MREQIREQQETLRHWLRRIKENTGWSWSKLAKDAGLGAPSTITRFVNNKNVTHVLSTTTLGKIEALFRQRVDLAKRDSPEMLKAMGRRMALTRSVMAPTMSDVEVANVMGWSPLEMEGIFAGREAVSLEKLWAFATRMNVTTDFLLYEKLDGLTRKSERLLLEADPHLGLTPKDTAPDTDKPQP